MYATPSSGHELSKDQSQTPPTTDVLHPQMCHPVPLMCHPCSNTAGPFSTSYCYAALQLQVFKPADVLFRTKNPSWLCGILIKPQMLMKRGSTLWGLWCQERTHRLVFKLHELRVIKTYSGQILQHSRNLPQQNGWKAPLNYKCTFLQWYFKEGFFVI